MVIFFLFWRIFTYNLQRLGNTLFVISEKCNTNRTALLCFFSKMDTKEMKTLHKIPQCIDFLLCWLLCPFFRSVFFSLAVILIFYIVFYRCWLRCCFKWWLKSSLNHRNVVCSMESCPFCKIYIWISVFMRITMFWLLTHQLNFSYILYVWNDNYNTPHLLTHSLRWYYILALLKSCLFFVIVVVALFTFIFSWIEAKYFFPIRWIRY